MRSINPLQLSQTQAGRMSFMWSRTRSKFIVAIALIGTVGFLMSASAQSPDPGVGRHLAETVCSACHQIDAHSQGPGPNPDAPNFVDISRMPSMNDLAIKLFLGFPHPSMPNIILSPEEIDSVTAYIRSLNKK